MAGFVVLYIRVNKKQLTTTASIIIDLNP